MQPLRPFPLLELSQRFQFIPTRRVDENAQTKG